jgi:ABC-2 type transport system ATP-binding protein
MEGADGMIRCHELTKKYRRNEALHGVTLEVPEGSAFALLGPNGAGKSTLIKTVMNILRPTSGRAEVLGVDSRRLGPRELSQIGYVSENQELPEWMTVAAFLAYCKPLYPNWRDEDAAEMVRAFGLPLDRKLRALSRGMRLKAALAASLAYRPKLIVLDEPFSGLDVLVREQLIESIVERTPEATVLLASHDLAEIESFATHVAYLNEGRVEFVEEIASLFDRFREVEVTAEDAPAGGAPRDWLNVERSPHVVRFTDARFQGSAAVAERFPGAKEIVARPMSLRQIVIALAKSARRTE